MIEFRADVFPFIRFSSGSSGVIFPSLGSDLWSRVSGGVLSKKFELVMEVSKRGLTEAMQKVPPNGWRGSGKHSKS